MKRKLIVFAALLMLAIAPLATAQCPEEYWVEVGTSECITVCAGQPVIINLEGNRPGPDAIPILTWEIGCQTLHCNTECQPVDVPDTLVYGSDPWYPYDYCGESGCLIACMRWVHDAFWVIDIFSFCNGCFCLTFDYQLAADLVSFTALPGNGEVTLNWATASESNNDHFEIERGGAVVASVEASNQATGDEYSYTDRGLINGTEYTYTLVAVDINGQRDALQAINATPFDNNHVVVTSYALYQNYPNPFNPETSIAFDLVEDGFVSLAIYNVLGEQLSTLVDGRMSSGRHTVVFNGASFASGVYLYKLTTNGFSDTKKLVLLK
jgi:hypothetical protein